MEKLLKPFHPPASQQALWLVFFDNGSQMHYFFNMVEGRSYHRNISELDMKTCRMYSYGWLLMVVPPDENDFCHAEDDQCDAEDDLCESRDCFLLNPITMEKIELPPVNLDKEFLNMRYWLPCVRFRCIMSSEPTEQSCVVLFLSCHKPIIIFCHLREKKWERIRYNLNVDGGLFDFVTCRGKIYGLTYQEKLVVVEFDPNPVVRVLEEISRVNRPKRVTNWEVQLVESRGELFLVSKETVKCPCLVISFRVDKLNFAEDRWVQVQSIGDRAFFLTNANSTSCSACEYGIERDSIYYVEEDDPCLYRFDMTERSISMVLPIPNLTELDDTENPYWIYM